MVIVLIIPNAVFGRRLWFFIDHHTGIALTGELIGTEFTVTLLSLELKERPTRRNQVKTGPLP